MNVDEVRNTDLLQISVLDTDPQEAANIANKIVAVYQEKRVQEEREILNRAVETMNEEVAKEDKRVDEAATEVARIRDAEHIVDLNPESTEDTVSAANTNVLKQEGEVNDAETKVSTLQAKLQQIENLKGEDLMRMMPTLDIQDPTIQKILPSYQEAVAQEAQLLNSGLGENHPKVKALRATKAVYIRQLEQQVTSVRDALQHNLNSRKETRDQLKQRLDAINEEQVTSKNLSANYTRAKNTYIKEKSLLDGARSARANADDGNGHAAPGRERETGRGAALVRGASACGFEHGAGRACRPRARHRARLFHRVSRYQREDDGRRRDSARRPGARDHSAEHQAPAPGSRATRPTRKPTESCARTLSSTARAPMPIPSRSSAAVPAKANRRRSPTSPSSPRKEAIPP